MMGVTIQCCINVDKGIRRSELSTSGEGCDNDEDKKVVDENGKEPGEITRYV